MRKKIEIGRKILDSNEKYAKRNSVFFAEKKLVCLNLISSPGSGKTTILTETIRKANQSIRIGVIEGDIQTDLDAQRIKAVNAPAIQIETGGSCHLSAAQITEALKQLPTDELDLVIIENVGNLVCPSVFELGESAKVAVLSVAEGDDKPIKYPALFSRAKAMIINKIDLLDAGIVDFDLEKVKCDALKLNPDIQIFPISAKTGKGMDSWCKWLIEQCPDIQARSL